MHMNMHRMRVRDCKTNTQVRGCTYPQWTQVFADTHAYMHRQTHTHACTGDIWVCAYPVGGSEGDFRLWDAVVSSSPRCVLSTMVQAVTHTSFVLRLMNRVWCRISGRVMTGLQVTPLHQQLDVHAGCIPWLESSRLSTHVQACVKALATTPQLLGYW
jgi:hypothetical protein